MKKALHELWAPSRYTIPVNEGQLVQARLTDGAFTVRDASMKTSPPPTLVTGTRLDPASPVGLQEQIAKDVLSADGDAALQVPGKQFRSQSSEGPTDAAVVNLSTVAEVRTDTYANKADAESTRRKPRIDDEGCGDVVAAGDNDDLIPSAGGMTSERQTIQQRLRVGEHADGEESEESSEATEAGDARDNFQSKGTRSLPISRSDKTGPAAIRVKDGKRPTDNTTTVAAESTAVSTRETTDRSSVRGQAGVSHGAPLAFDLPGILAGCREASSAKRKRDERNTSAYSFSGKLSGRASADDQDSKAAARAFSRVLRKVSGTCVARFVVKTC